MKGENSEADKSRCTTKLKKRRLPRAVRYWFEQLQKEGESDSAAWYHAVARANESGEISDATADRLEADPIFQTQTE